MATYFGRSLLSVFDVSEDSRDFLVSLIDSHVAPAEEVQCLWEQSLMAGAEAWNHLIDCARWLQQAQRHRLGHLDGHDLLAFIWAMFCGPHDHDILQPAQPWEETDRLIRLARKLERDVEVRLPTTTVKRRHKDKTACPSSCVKRRRTSQGIDSHYWSDELLDQEDLAVQHNIDRKPQNKKHILPIGNCASGHDPCAAHAEDTEPRPNAVYADLTCCPSTLTPLDRASGDPEQPAGGLQVGRKQSVTRKTQSTKSPYFSKPELQNKKTPPRTRPPPGTVSCIPFPPLTAPRFGLIQEELAHEPFWLLMAITLLIKTNGKLAIPAFHKVRERFPTFEDLLNGDNQEELLGMIQHLGLSKVRLGYIHRYARAFLEERPMAGARYRVKNYDKRDISPQPQQQSSSSSSSSSSPSRSHDRVDDEHWCVTPDGMQALEAWEIGHMTQGKYAIDSWRIFCRDELLGRATDWNGQGREPEFQPEWMRTRPDDKELRAYLLWMWMREGWEWDPATGERTVLREEMRRAVNEGRVEYDEAGGLRILG